MTERLAVLLYDQIIGTLERPDDGSLPTFSYAEEYVANGRTPLSLRLPIASKPYPGRRVDPYLRGLLPENASTRERWADQFDVAPDDTFALLGEMGWDCPGAVQFCLPDEVTRLRERRSEYVPIDDKEIAKRLRDLAVSPASWTMPGEHWSLGGQQEKFALARIDGKWHEVHGSAATTHILKPGIPSLMHQALVEHVTMAAAGALGIAVAPSAFTRFEDQWAIVVERFDRAGSSKEGILRVHQEDFCQALGRLPEVKYESRGGPTLKHLAGVVKRSSTRRGDDLRALADFLAINLVAAAPDGHAKNISLLLPPDGQLMVAPLYDLATGLSYEGTRVERQIAVSVGGERTFSRIRRRQWERAAITLDLPPSQLISRVATLCEHYPDAFATALNEYADVPGSAEVAQRTLPALAEHCRRLLSQL